MVMRAWRIPLPHNLVHTSGRRGSPQITASGQAKNSALFLGKPAKNVRSGVGFLLSKQSITKRHKSRGVDGGQKA